MKSIRQLLTRSALVCLSLIPAALAGPGGSYGPTAPRGYNPTNNLDGGFGGGFSHRGYDYNNRSYGPSGTGYRSDRFRDDHDHDHPPFDRDRDRDRDWDDRDRRPGPGPGPGPIVRRDPNPRDRVIRMHRPNYYTGGWYHGDWHNNWGKSVKARPYAWNGWGNGWKGWNGKLTGTVASSPWRFGYWSYYNPYYTTTANVPSYFNYSQPIISANITVDDDGFYPQVRGNDTREHALQHFASARQAFFRGDLRRAQNEIDDAIATLPSDTVLHEFRSLVLFARRDYSAAAGCIYAVLSSGPGWDWTTMIGLYPNANIYTEHLRILEDYCSANPRAANARFLLGYHYLTAGHIDAAAEMYRQVVAINPRDSLSAQLMASLTGASYGQSAQLPQFDPRGIDDRYISGNWTATRDDGSTFQLSLRPDGAFTWVYSHHGFREQLSGAYSLSDGTLLLQQDGQPAMAGQIYRVGPNRFVFKLIGADPYDPGLTFYR